MWTHASPGATMRESQQTPTWSASLAPKLPPYVSRITTKAGRSYLYLCRGRGTAAERQRVRLPDDPGSPEFWAEYARLMQLPAPRVNPHCVAELVRAWHASPEWEGMAIKTRGEWARYCRRIVDVWGTLEVRGIEPRHVLALRDHYRATPASANNLLRCLSTMLRWSVPRGWRSDNPCRDVPKLAGGEAYEPWPWPVIEQVRDELRPDLWWAVALALYTGQRTGDILAMRWDALASGMLAVKQEKTAKRLAIPIHRDLQQVLDTVPRCAVTILTSTEARPWTKDGFKSAWRKQRPACTKGLVFHGLRKSAVVTLLEAGCTDAEVASITGQSRDMVIHYGKRVNQEKLAKSAMIRWERAKC